MLSELKVKQESDVDAEAFHMAVPPKATMELVPQPPKTLVSVALHGDAGDLHSRSGDESSAAVVYADMEGCREDEDAETEHLIQVGSVLKLRAVGIPWQSPQSIMNRGACEARMTLKLSCC